MTPNKEPEAVDVEATKLALAIERLNYGKNMQIVFTAMSMALAGCLRSIPAHERVYALARVNSATADILEEMEEGNDADGSPHRKAH